MQRPQLSGQQALVDVSCREFTESIHDRRPAGEIQEARLPESVLSLSEHVLSASCLCRETVFTHMRQWQVIRDGFCEVSFEEDPSLSIPSLVSTES